MGRASPAASSLRQVRLLLELLRLRLATAHPELTGAPGQQQQQKEEGEGEEEQHALIKHWWARLSVPAQLTDKCAPRPTDQCAPRPDKCAPRPTDKCVTAAPRLVGLCGAICSDPLLVTARDAAQRLCVPIAARWPASFLSLFLSLSPKLCVSCVRVAMHRPRCCPAQLTNRAPPN
eukprot:COSAG01_NODE_2898_length_6893_cov_45.927878_5_plen_176_part_00